MKVICSFITLGRLAKKEADARLHGTQEEYEKAKQDHEAYRQLCLHADEVHIGLRRGDLK